MLLNPRRRRRHYRRNPEGVIGPVTDLVKHPGDSLMTGLIGGASAYMTLSIPNNFLPFAGDDILSRVLRLATRAATGGLVYSLFRKMSHRHAQAALAGASIASVGSFVFEFLGTTIPIGVPLAANTMPLLPIGNFSLGLDTVGTGLGAYAKLRGYSSSGAMGRGPAGGSPNFFRRGPAGLGAYNPNPGLAGPRLTKHNLFN